MALTADCIVELIEQLAPKNLAENWDNVGWQVGDCRAPVTTVLLALDPSPAALAAARKLGAELLITHHPLIFRPLKHLRLDFAGERLVAEFLEARVGVYAAHTNLDNAPAGTSQVLADLLGLQGSRVLLPQADAGPGCGLGRVGLLPRQITFAEFCARVKEILAVPTLTVSGDRGRLIEKVAVCGGSGSSLIGPAHLAGAQVLLTGDVGYHDVLDAGLCGLALIDAGHAGTENPVIHFLERYLQERLAGYSVAIHSYIAPPECDVR